MRALVSCKTYLIFIIMRPIIRAALLCGTACIAMAATSCKKDETVKMPETLKGSKWDHFELKDPDMAVVSSMEFRDATHALYTSTTYKLDTDGKEDKEHILEQIEIDFDYTYRKPDIRMTPTGEGPALTGSIDNAPDCNTMTLKRSDGSTFFTSSKGIRYFEWQ